MEREDFIYCGIVLCLFLLYVIYKMKTKELFHNKIKCFTEIFFFFTMSTFVFVLSSVGIRYSMNSMQAIALFASLFLLCFSFGCIQNNRKTYNTNISIYFGLYLVLLMSITFFIGRPTFRFQLDRIFSIYKGSLIPFHTISLYFNGYASTKEIVYNIFGNMMLLVPLSFLLMIKNKKYNHIFRQLCIIVPLVVFIELFQEITWVGSFDIDDILLNVFGPILFTFLITRFDIIGKIRSLFYRDFIKNKSIQYFLYFISLIIPVLFIIKTIVKIID